MPDAAIASPDVSATVAALMSGDVFTALAFDTVEQRAAALEAVLAAFVDEGTRVAWVGNPLRSPLNIERILLQLIGPEIDLRIERGPAELARLIAGRRGTESRLLVVLQQPETIPPETLEQLGALAGHLGEEAVQVQFLLVGSPALRLPPAPAEIGRLLLAPPRDASPVPEPAAAEPRRRDVLPLILLLLAVCLGVVFSMAAPPPTPEPAMATTPTAAPVVAPVAAPRAADDTDGLKRRFEAFLAERAATLPPLSQAQKDSLFAEFLTHHHRE